jgi:hypothetical protein
MQTIGSLTMQLELIANLATKTPWFTPKHGLPTKAAPRDFKISIRISTMSSLQWTKTRAFMLFIVLRSQEVLCFDHQQSFFAFQAQVHEQQPSSLTGKPS